MKHLRARLSAATLGWIWVAAGALSLPALAVTLVATPMESRSDDWSIVLFFIALGNTILFATGGLLAVFGVRRARGVAIAICCVSFLPALLVLLGGATSQGWVAAAWGAAVIALCGYSLAQLAARGPGTDRHAAAARTAALQIFVSYRRSDGADVCDRICEHLAEAFPNGTVFRDIDSIPLGVDFRSHVDAAIARCDVLLAVVGPGWVDCRDEANERRLQDPADLVRLEIEAALGRAVPVIPLLINQTRMPKPLDLPESLQPFAYHNGQAIRRDPDFRHDLDRLIAALDELGARRAAV